jgi:hypothetical protein
MGRKRRFEPGDGIISVMDASDDWGIDPAVPMRRRGFEHTESAQAVLRNEGREEWANAA